MELDAQLDGLTREQRRNLETVLEVVLIPRPSCANDPQGRCDRVVTTPDGARFRSNKAALRHLLSSGLVDVGNTL